MKIAILVPGTSSPVPRDPRYELGHRLLETLKDTSYEIVVHPVPMDESRETTASFPTLKTLYAFFSKMEGYDLVHNLIGLLPLFLVPSPKVPILTTFFNPPGKEVYAFMKTAPPLLFFTSTTPISDPGRGNYLGTLDPSNPSVPVSKLYERIDALTRREDHRPWGYYVVLADASDHKVKRIVVWPQKRLSLQRHRRRSEHWHIIQGKAIVTLDNRQLPLEAGQSVDIPKGTAHRIQNPEAGTNLVFIEIQRGDYFGEDDIERLEDDFGRA